MSTYYSDSRYLEGHIYDSYNMSHGLNPGFRLIASSPDNIGMMKDFTEFDDLVRSFMLLQGGCTADDSPSVSIGG